MIPVLTVRHPWSAAIFDLGKDVENRTRDLFGDYRGPAAIHVSRTHDGPAALHRIEQIVGHDVRLENLQAGHIIGVVLVTNVHRYPTPCIDTDDGAPCSRWAQLVEGMVHTWLSRPTRLRHPIWARGQLGLWHIDEGDLRGRWFEGDEEAMLRGR